MKKYLSVLSIIIMLGLSVPTMAFAAEKMPNAITEVSYTVASDYEINIPAAINVNENPRIEVTASRMNLTVGKELRVTINGSRTYENGGNFYLYKNKGQADEEKIACEFWSGGTCHTGLEAQIARFLYNETINRCEPLEVRPIGGLPGKYTGSISFNVVVQ